MAVGARRGASIAVVVRLVRAFFFHADVGGLLVRQNGEFRADATQMQAGDFFVQMLGQHIHFVFIRSTVLEQLDLCQGLIGE